MKKRVDKIYNILLLLEILRNLHLIPRNFWESWREIQIPRKMLSSPLLSSPVSWRANKWTDWLTVSLDKLQLQLTYELVLEVARIPSPPPTTLTVDKFPRSQIQASHCTQSQEYKSEVRAQEIYAAMRIKTHLDNVLYLSSLLSEHIWQPIFASVRHL